jgi:SNF2 family DNA or RNA helicase
MQMDSEETTNGKLPYCTNCTNQIKRYTAMISPAATASVSASTKINKMLDILQHTRQHHPDDKTIIFSQFTSMLDLMEEPLQELGFKYCRCKLKENR